MESTPSPTPAETGPGPADDKQNRCGPGTHRRGRGRWFVALLLVAVVAGTAGGFIGKSFGRNHGVLGAGDPAKMHARIERMIGHFASRVDATPAQQEKLAAIAKGAAKDIAPVRSQLAEARRQVLAMAAAPAIDRAGLERLRAEQFGLADTLSKRLTQALADAAEVLTAEQRQKLTARIAGRMERRESFRRGV